MNSLAFLGNDSLSRSPAPPGERKAQGREVFS